MSAPFVTSLRVANDDAIRVGSGAEPFLHLRAQVASGWDALKLDVSPDASVREVKLAALEHLAPDSYPADQYAVKLRGFEVLDENVTVAESGAVNGSTFLILDRRRRPTS